MYCSGSVQQALSIRLLYGFHYSAGATALPFTLSFSLQVFYAMCQGLLYAFCYHLDSLLSRNDSEDAMSAAQLQNVHISDAMSAPGLRQSPSCMQPAAIRQTLSQLLPCILHHRYRLAHDRHVLLLYRHARHGLQAACIGFPINHRQLCCCPSAAEASCQLSSILWLSLHSVCPVVIKRLFVMLLQAVAADGVCSQRGSAVPAAS